MRKSVEEKAEEVCRKLHLPEFGPHFMTIRHALKEQDRDTRHACAEAVMQFANNVSSPFVARNAYAACMNAEATKGE